MSVASSCAGVERRDNMDIEHQDEDENNEDLSNEQKFGNLRRQKFSPLALVDIHSRPRKEIAKKSIIKKRTTTIASKKRKLELIDMAAPISRRRWASDGNCYELIWRRPHQAITRGLYCLLNKNTKHLLLSVGKHNNILNVIYY
jgi:hypothetical protein